VIAGTKTVLEAQAPAFSVQQAEAIARQAFDIQASAHPLEDGSEWVLTQSLALLMVAGRLLPNARPSSPVAPLGPAQRLI